MKRFLKVAVIAAVFGAVGASQVFAKSDLQLNLGLWHGKVEADLKTLGITWGSAEESYNSVMAGLTNYNLFDVAGPVLSVGFMESLTGYFGGDFCGFDFLIGPAVGVNVFDVVKFQCAFGLSLGIISENGDESYGSGEDFSYSSGAIGFGVDVQAKFIPGKKVSPLVGFRYEFNKLKDDEPFVDVTDKATEVYCGFGVNF